MSSLEYLEEIDASGNPYECTCDLKAFLAWTNTTHAAVLSSHRQLTTYLCDFPPDLYGVPIFDQEVEAKISQCSYIYSGYVNGGGVGEGRESGRMDYKKNDGFVGDEEKLSSYEVVGVNYYNEEKKVSNDNTSKAERNSKKNGEENHFGFYGSHYLIGSLAFLCLIGGVGCVAITCYVTQVFKKVKGLKYRWQIRYREVSAVENQDYK